MAKDMKNSVIFPQIANLLKAVTVFTLVFCSNCGTADASMNSKGTTELFLCLQENGLPSIAFIPRDNTSQFYNDLNYQWNTRKGIIQPLAYILPETTHHVQIAVICGKQLNIKMVAKGGGHSHEKYSFGNKDAVIVDLQKLNYVNIRSEESAAAADVGSGVLMGHLVWWLWTNGGYAIPTTDCPNAGIAGATLNGGFGVWSKRWGMLSDNVLEFEMVDAGGKILIANSTANSDLYWALRGGGGGNFGIVTRFKYQLQPVSDLKVTFVQFIYSFEQFPSVLSSLLSWYQTTHGSPIHTYISVEADGQVIVYVIDMDMSPIQIEILKAAFPQNSTSLTITESNFIEYVAAEAYPPKSVDELANVTRNEYPQYSSRVKTYFSSQILTQSEINLVNDVCKEIPAGVFLYIDAWGGALQDVGRNETAFVHRDALFMLHVSLRTDDLAADEWVNRFDDVVGPVLNSTEGFQTLIDESVGDYLQFYYAENLERLVQVKRMVDPDNYFSFAQSIPLKT